MHVSFDAFTLLCGRVHTVLRPAGLRHMHGADGSERASAVTPQASSSPSLTFHVDTCGMSFGRLTYAMSTMLLDPNELMR